MNQISDLSIEQIQTKIAYLEQANADLSDVVFRQDREIQRLGAKIEAISERLTAAQSDEPSLVSEERPPHY